MKNILRIYFIAFFVIAGMVINNIPSGRIEFPQASPGGMLKLSMDNSGYTEKLGFPLISGEKKHWYGGGTQVNRYPLEYVANFVIVFLAFLSIISFISLIRKL